MWGYSLSWFEDPSTQTLTKRRETKRTTPTDALIFVPRPTDYTEWLQTRNINRTSLPLQTLHNFNPKSSYR